MANNNNSYSGQPHQDEPTLSSTDLNLYVQIWNRHRLQLTWTNRVIRVKRALYENFPPVGKSLIQALAREHLDDDVFVAVSSQPGHEEICLGTFQSLRDLNLPITQRQERFPMILSPGMPPPGPQNEQAVPRMPPQMPHQMPRLPEVYQAENGQGERKRVLPDQVEQSPSKRFKASPSYSEELIIKRPPNCWVLFRSWGCNHFKLELEGITAARKSTWLRAVWAQMSVAMKQPFRDLQDRLAREHKARFPSWKYKPKPKNARQGSSNAGGNGAAGQQAPNPVGMPAGVREDLEAQEKNFHEFTHSETITLEFDTTSLLPLMRENMPVRAAPIHRVPAAREDRADASESHINADEVEDVSAGPERQAPALPVAPEAVPPENSQQHRQTPQDHDHDHDHDPQPLHEAPSEDPQPFPEMLFEPPTALSPNWWPEVPAEDAPEFNFDFDFDFSGFVNRDFSTDDPQPAAPGAQREPHSDNGDNGGSFPPSRQVPPDGGPGEAQRGVESEPAPPETTNFDRHSGWLLDHVVGI
ncbi:hypothetical protein F4775DRAFT_588138 [Biscogniauxia sp. FL1348]|nr:hypothetical protein F4775DRAFT_588138 [Biscogniauxia sp. FL1348]